MQSKDKLEIVANLRESGFDMTQKLVAPVVAQVEKYANTRKIEPSDDPDGDAVDRFIQVDNNKFVALLNSGGKIPVSQQTYLSEATYNFLPSRYKTMKL